MTSITPGEFWSALALRPSPATIVTTADADHGPAGFVGLSATHVSAAPAMMSVAVNGSTSALAPLRQSKSFAINYLSSSGVDVWQRFSAKDAPKGAGRFDGLVFDRSETGVPIFSAITCGFECRLKDDVEIEGTHILVGEVVRIHKRTDVRPLVYFGGAILALSSA